MGWHIHNQIIANNVVTKEKRQWMMFMMTDQIMLFVRSVDFASSVEIAKSLDVGGKMAKINSVMWLIGYFVVMAPLNLYLSHGIIWSLGHSIIGVAGAIAFVGWKK